MQEYDYWLSTLHIVPHKKVALTRLLGNAKEVFFAKENTLINTGLCDFKIITKIKEHKKNFKTNAFDALTKMNIKFVSINDDGYPIPLKSLYDPPYGLFFCGNMPKNWDSAVSVVGSRKATAYGRVCSRDIAKKITMCDGLIISGLARGIDSAAHSGALEAKGKTVSVLGCGVDICSPKENRNLYENIKSNGCLISEYEPTTPPYAEFFPQRNRIISGLAKAVVVIEAAKKSGSLITADLALEQGRDVYALPGRMGDIQSEGCNKLIREGAGIIYDIDSFVNDLTEDNILTKKVESESKIDFPKEETKLLRLLDYNPKGIDEIVMALKSDVKTAIFLLNSMEAKGYITQKGKNRYVRNVLTNF